MIGEIGGTAEEEAADVDQGEHDQAGGGLHRRDHGARRQADGPRRRHHLRRQGHRCRARSRLWKRPASSMAPTPTDMGSAMLQALGPLQLSRPARGSRRAGTPGRAVTEFLLGAGTRMGGRDHPRAAAHPDHGDVDPQGIPRRGNGGLGAPAGRRPRRSDSAARCRVDVRRDRALAVAWREVCSSCGWAYDTIRNARRGPPPLRPGSDLLKGVVTNLLSPHPWLFWLTVGAPILVMAWSDNPASALAFLGGFYGLMVAHEDCRRLSRIAREEARWAPRGTPACSLAAACCSWWDRRLLIRDAVVG